MHIKSLKVFCDVVGWRSFSRAADENGISQSGASQVVHQLETRLQVKLIDRSKRPFILTAEGESFYEGCRKIVQRYYALEEQVRTLHTDVSGKVRVVSIYSVGLHHMNRAMQQFMGQYPKANVRLEYQHPDAVYDAVEKDQADFGLVSYPRESRTIEATMWREEPMMLVCSPTHRLAKFAEVPWAELAGEKMVCFDADLTIRREIDRVLLNHKAEVKVVMEFDNIETIKRAVEIDTGVAVLPMPTVEREVAVGTLVAIPFATADLVRPIGVVRRRGKELSNAAKKFLEMLLQDILADEVSAAEPALLAIDAPDTEASSPQENGSDVNGVDASHGESFTSGDPSNHKVKRLSPLRAK